MRQTSLLTDCICVLTLAQIQVKWLQFSTRSRHWEVAGFTLLSWRLLLLPLMNYSHSSTSKGFTSAAFSMHSGSPWVHPGREEAGCEGQERVLPYALSSAG